MYSRARQQTIDSWKYDLSLEDLNVEFHDHGDECFEEPKDDDSMFNFFITLRFPRYDLEEVKRKVAEHLPESVSPQEQQSKPKTYNKNSN